jgi:hypothetical protein
MPALKKVSIIGMPLHVFHIHLYRQLTHLTINYWNRTDSVYDYHYEFASLPLLTYLALCGHLGYIHTLRTPSLVTLVIRDIWEYQEYHNSFPLQPERRSIRDISPEILHTDCLSNVLSTNDFLDLIRHIGQNVKQLYITYTSEWGAVSKDVIDNLIGRISIKGGRKGAHPGGHDRVSMCPLLQKLEVLTPRPIHRSVKGLTRKNLQRLVNSRSTIAAGGSLPLQRVRHGIYPPDDLAKYPNEVWYAASRKWWMIEWEELLWL